ncbi:MAG: hypothetical protein ACI9XK_003965 [Granulosicoccus sp.]
MEDADCVVEIEGGVYGKWLVGARDKTKINGLISSQA